MNINEWSISLWIKNKADYHLKWRSLFITNVLLAQCMNELHFGNIHFFFNWSFISSFRVISILSKNNRTWHFGTCRCVMKCYQHHLATMANHTGWVPSPTDHRAPQEIQSQDQSASFLPNCGLCLCFFIFCTVWEWSRAGVET